MPASKELLRQQSDFDDRVPIVDQIVVGSDGQTSLPNALSVQPLNPSRVMLKINGVWYPYTTYFTLSGPTNRDLTWLDVGFILETTDIIYAEYFPY